MKIICIENEYNKGLEYVSGRYNITIGKTYDVVREMESKLVREMESANKEYINRIFNI
jgi:hypothetical protein